MNKAKILRASKALKRLETAQEHFNAAIDALSDVEVLAWAKENDVTIEPSKSKLRIEKLTVADSSMTPSKKEVKKP
jgi:predicted nucleic acid-binding protein